MHTFALESTERVAQLRSAAAEAPKLLRRRRRAESEVKVSDRWLAYSKSKVYNCMLLWLLVQ